MYTFRKTIATLIFVAVNYICSAQMATEVNVTSAATTIGIDRRTLQPFPANEFRFPERISELSGDSINQTVNLQLRGLSNNGKWLDNKGLVVRYDLSGKKVRWAKKILYQTQAVENFGGATLWTNAGKSYCLDSETGEQVWEVKTALIHAAPKLNIALGYNQQGAKTTGGRLHGLNLKNGEELWERPFNVKYGFDNAYMINDSLILVAASGLHTVHWKTGKGWDYEAVTGKADYKGLATKTGLAILSAALTGSYSLPTGADMVRKLSSNILLDSVSIYFASSTNLAMLRMDGKVLWNTPLAEGETSTSRILKTDGSIVMINLGYAYMGQRKINFGQPYLASFDLKSGKENFKLPLTTDKENILDIKILKDDVVVAFSDRLERYAMKSGKLVGSKNIGTKENKLVGFVGRQVHVKADSIYNSVVSSDNEKLVVYTENGMAYEFDPLFKSTRSFDLKDIYIAYLNRGGYTFLAKEQSTVIVDKSGNPRAELPGSFRSVMLGDKYYGVKDQSIFEVSLSKFFIEQKVR